MLNIFESSLSSLSTIVALGAGLVFGLKHATEVDHIMAVSSIVSEHRNLFRSLIVGVLWGLGHTASLMVVGLFVLVLHIAIPAWVSGWLEFGVALMIIGLGVSAVLRVLQKCRDFHRHRHSHDGVSHIHIHFHEVHAEYAVPVANHSHAVALVGMKPVMVGAMHGLAGSAALTLLVLSQIQSALIGLMYLGVFGVGSIIGMLVMSGFLGFVLVVTSRRLVGIHYSLQTLPGAVSIVFGLWYAYETGFVNGLW